MKDNFSIPLGTVAEMRAQEQEFSHGVFIQGTVFFQQTAGKAADLSRDIGGIPAPCRKLLRLLVNLNRIFEGRQARGYIVQAFADAPAACFLTLDLLPAVGNLGRSGDMRSAEYMRMTVNHFGADIRHHVTEIKFPV